ncbi:hypothetical protein HPHPA9_0453 [Helicobacter pylori Hp A-9]|uniref:Uncharacterized protein n=1 Tax=Helicobacter pylori Hp A-9 TaxID=992034 RepID=I9RJF8_HELPX|nr:hypothetical protein HPHPA9_0453 [Helicobacter pylori Hp A-9]
MKIKNKSTASVSCSSTALKGFKKSDNTNTHHNNKRMRNPTQTR